MALSAFGDVNGPGRHERECDLGSDSRRGARLLHESRFHHARVSVDEGRGGVFLGGFLEGEVVHADGVRGGVFEAEVGFEIEVGEIEVVGLLAGGEDGYHAGEFGRCGAEEREELGGESEAGVVICC